jgi:hypothetical protein
LLAVTHLLSHNRHNTMMLPFSWLFKT